MQRVCEGFYPDDPAVQELSPGTSYLDRAYDLLGYADVYAKRPAVAGHVAYRETDKADAHRLAGELLAALGKEMNAEQKLAFDLLRRAWTFLKPVYFEVQQVGLAGLRYDPAREQRFPSLYVVGRKGVGRKKAKKDASATEGVAKDGLAPKDASKKGDE